MQLLIQHGADVHARDDAALKAACVHGDVDVVEVLLQHGADVHAENDRVLRSG